MQNHFAARIAAAVALVGTVASIAATASATAAELPASTAAAAFSINHGFAQTSLSAQRRLAAGAAADVSTALIRNACGARCAQQAVTRRPGALRISGSDWSLDVSADGTAARFADLAVLRGRFAQGRDVARKLPATTLESTGRAIIASKLSSAIVLGAYDELVPLRTDYLIAGLQNVKTHVVTRSVIANRITFGRRLRGVPVVGGGSTVSLTFANSGALESWRYDWPRYAAASAASQPLVNVRTIVQRVNRVLLARRSDGRTPAGARSISGKIQANAPSGKAGAALQKLECGYFDPGIGGSAATGLVQPGCVYHVVARDADGFRQGYAGAVPGGASFTRDPGWVESAIIPSR